MCSQQISVLLFVFVVDTSTCNARAYDWLILGHLQAGHGPEKPKQVAKYCSNYMYNQHINFECLFFTRKSQTSALLY